MIYVIVDKHFLNYMMNKMTRSKKFPRREEEKPAFVYYYLRIIQEDGHIAWSSPIWIDLQDIQPQASKKSKKKA